jgi:hypothetical protein
VHCLGVVLCLTADALDELRQRSNRVLFVIHNSSPVKDRHVTAPCRCCLLNRFGQHQVPDVPIRCDASVWQRILLRSLNESLAMNTLRRLAALLAVLAMSGGTAMAVDKPDYEIIGKSGDIEYRRYAPYVIAETRIDGDWSANRAGNEGFRRLVAFISGNNARRGKIAMTAPVAQSRGETIAMTAPVGQSANDGDWLVYFVMPPGAALEDLPEPRDPRIELKAVPAKTVAALRYSGSWSEKKYQAQERRLLEAIAGDGIEAVSQPEFARYNAPFVPSFFRRNEILVTVDRVPESVAGDWQVALAR